MDKIITDEKNKKNILYSTKVFDSKNEEQPSFILRELQVDEGTSDEKTERKVSLILKYKINGEEQNVVLATSEQFKDRTEKTRVIIKYLTEQFKDNFEGKLDFNHIDKLNQYLNRERVPFKLTLEGRNIISYKDKEDISVLRTVEDNGEGKLKNYFSDEDIERMKEEQKKELRDYLNEKKQEKKWNERREKILKQLDNNKEEKEKFLRGEKITHFLEKNDKEPETKRNLVGLFLIEKLEKSDGKGDIAKLSKDFIQLKEKGFAINVKVVLEKQLKKCYATIQKEMSKENVNQQRIDQVMQLIDRINEYSDLFELVKDRMNWNVVFTYKAKKLNFEEVKVLCENYDPKDKEILEYLNLKEKTICDDHLNQVGKENSYFDSDSIKKLYRFLAKSNLKDYTTPDVGFSAKNVVLDKARATVKTVYDHIVREFVEYNADDISFYNKYAKKSEWLKTYSVKSEENEEERKKNICNVVKKISEEVFGEGQKEQIPQNSIETITVHTAPSDHDDHDDHSYR